MEYVPCKVNVNNYNILIIGIIVILLIGVICFFMNRGNNDNPIDLVYTWVDGSDKKWLDKKNKYSKNISSVEDNIRYTNIDELKYSLRSVYKYANWVSNIYIVVDDDQKPEWLNLQNPKIHLIKHSEIFSNINDLPTFNSHSIECNLHNIPNLSKYFIYMNDDMFFGNYINKSDYISDKLHYFNNHNNCTFNVNNIPESKFNGYYDAWNKTQDLLFNKLNITPSCQWHQGLILNKENFKSINTIFKNEFKNTVSSKFRIGDNIVPIGMVYQYGLKNGDYIKKTPLSNIVINLNENNNLDKILNHIKTKKPHTFCLNNNENVNNDIIINFLNSYFPDKSPYELPLKNKVLLITQYYEPNNSERMIEIKECLINNNNNKLIDEIHLFIEKDYNFDFIKNNKIKFIKTDKQLSFKKVFDYSNTFDDNHIIILANSDIYFDESLQNIHYIDFNKTFYALNKYNLDKNNNLVLDGRHNSQDTWIWKPPINIIQNENNSNDLFDKNDGIILGVGSCDTRILKVVEDSGYKIRNICRQIRSIHNHKNDYRPWMTDPYKKKLQNKYIKNGRFKPNTTFLI